MVGEVVGRGRGRSHQPHSHVRRAGAHGGNGGCQARRKPFQAKSGGLAAWRSARLSTSTPCLPSTALRHRPAHLCSSPTPVRQDRSPPSVFASNPQFLRYTAVPGTSAHTLTLSHGDSHPSSQVQRRSRFASGDQRTPADLETTDCGLVAVAPPHNGHEPRSLLRPFVLSTPLPRRGIVRKGWPIISRSGRQTAHSFDGYTSGQLHSPREHRAQWAATNRSGGTRISRRFAPARHRLLCSAKPDSSSFRRRPSAATLAVHVKGATSSRKDSGRNRESVYSL